MPVLPRLMSSVLLAAATLPALAQSGLTTPGQVGDTLKRPPEISAPPAATVEAQKRETPAAETTAAPTRVRISGFRFTGNNLYSSLELEALLGDFVERTVSLLDIYAAADRVAHYYAKSGYTLASVNVPPQKLSDGIVLLEISEGRIGKVTLENTATRSPERIRRYLGIKGGDLYRSTELERGMLLLDELPGLTARAVVKPGEEFGSTDVLIRTVDERVDGFVFADNHGRDNIGETRTALAVNFNNPAGIDDQIQLLGLVSSGGSLKFGSAGYNLPLGYGGVRGNVSYSFATFDLRAAPGFAEGEISGDSKTAKLGVDIPLVRSATDRFSASASLVDIRTSTGILGTAPTPGTSITFLELGAAYNHFYANAAITQLTMSLGSNFQSQKRADPETRDHQIARLELDAVQVQPLPARFVIIARANGIWSPDPLSDPTAYSIGGPQSVRGFLPSEVRGDRGWFAQLTLQQNHRFGSVAFSPRVFVDGGHVSLVDARDPPDNDLAGYGIGFDLAWRRLSLKLDAAKAAERDLEAGGERESGQVYASLVASF